MRRDLAVHLLHHLRPAAIVVPELVRRKIARGQPAARLEGDDLEAGPDEGKDRHSARGADADHGNVRLLQVRGDCTLACNARIRSSETAATHGGDGTRPACRANYITFGADGPTAKVRMDEIPMSGGAT